MLAGYIKPLVVRLSRSRLRYRFHDLMNKDLPVICYDMKRVVVGDSLFVKCHKIPWKDIVLVESERVIQSQIVNKTINNQKSSGKRDRYTPMFGPKSSQQKSNSFRQ
jgi:hypothetical protein